MWSKHNIHEYPVSQEDSIDNSGSQVDNLDKHAPEDDKLGTQSSISSPIFGRYLENYDESPT